MLCACSFRRFQRGIRLQASRAIAQQRRASLASPSPTAPSAQVSPSPTPPLPHADENSNTTTTTAINFIDVSQATQSALIQQQSQPQQPQQNNQHHHDLPSFLAYAHRVNLPSTSTVYVGTHYEYTVLRSLSRLGMSLSRIGGRSDHGVDLVGQWTLPLPSSSVASSSHPSSSTNIPLKMLVQCKSLHRRPGPYLIRELEGAFNGAPVGYRATMTRGGGVLGLLAAPKEATVGVREAMGRSRLPLLFAMVGNLDGRVTQLLWNQRAKEVGLDGLGVTVRYCDHDDDDDDYQEGNAKEVKKEVALTWNGEVLPSVQPSSQ